MEEPQEALRLDLGPLLDAAYYRASASLAEATEFATLCARFGRLSPDIVLPNVEVTVAVHPPDGDAVRAQFGGMAARYAVIAMVTACELYVNDVFTILYIGLKLAARRSGCMPLHRFQGHFATARAQAEGKGTLAGLRWIRDQTGATDADLPGAAWLADVMRVRNCVVHRGGVVAAEDAAGDSLRARWRHSYLTRDGQRVGPPPWEAKEGAEIAAAFCRDDVEREWRLGEAVTLTEQDTHDIALSLLALVDQLGAVTRVHLGRRFADHNAARSASPT